MDSFLSQGSFPLEQQVARLQALLEATRQVHSTAQADEILAQAARIIVRELEMDGALFLKPVTDEPVALYGRAPKPPFADCLRFPLLAKDGHPLAELIVTPPTDAEFSVFEQDFIEGLVLQTSVALEKATLHERDLVWARVQQDLDAARAIQRSLLPKAMPNIAAFSIAARSSACYEVGGDYLDVIELPDGGSLMVVADVAGKGLASAIVATSFRAAFRSMASYPIPLHELAAQIGEQHWSEGVEARRRYVTAIMLRLDPEKGEITVVNAGHNPGILVLPDGATRMIEASGTPLGMLPGMSYQAETLPFPPGARILLYTDGLTEVFQGDEEFGSERLLASFAALTGLDAGQTLDSLWQTLLCFCSNAPPTDDMTALAMCHLDSSAREFSSSCETAVR